MKCDQEPRLIILLGGELISKVQRGCQIAYPKVPGLTRPSTEIDFSSRMEDQSIEHREEGIQRSVYRQEVLITIHPYYL